MSYTIKYTETGNPQKPDITVEDQTLNQQLPVTFVGKNYVGYAQIIAENFLHLLENFAKTSAPTNPVEGQLWYDNSAGVNQLKVYDGTTWAPAGSIKKSNTAPAVANSNLGDLWADTDNQQLYLFTGSNWVLVGPQFSSGLRTGAEVESVVDASNITHSVLNLFVGDEKVGIISKDAFIPKSTISGFTEIRQGFNLSSKGLPNKFWGTSEKADSLVIGGNAVSASSFLRGDTASTTNFQFNVRNPSGLTVGSSGELSITIDSNIPTFNNKANGSAFDFKTVNNGVTSTVLRIDSTRAVGINNTAPAEALDVTGNIRISDSLIVAGTTDSTSLVTGSIKTAGGAAITKNLRVGGNFAVTGTSTTYHVIPDADGTYDLGTEPLTGGKAWRRIYADQILSQEFVGNLTGSVTGNVTGSASKLSSPTVFQLTGEVSSNTVSFDGQSTAGFATFTTTISQDFLTNRTETLTSQLNDEILINRPGTGLRKLTKTTLLQGVATMPIGTIMGFGGSTPPLGYLLCDGSEIRIGDYPELFTVIGYTFKATSLLIGSATFALPDLRGRFALGRDNMDNGNTVPSIADPTILIDAGGGNADRVTDVSADTLGTGSGTAEKSLTLSNIPDHEHDLRANAGTQFFAFRNSSTVIPDTNYITGQGPTAAGTGQYLPTSGGIDTAGSLGVAFSIMNPYMTVNYIIYTGR
jgi:microcystin-dependent protein